jgi:hypothetical protein
MQARAQQFYRYRDADGKTVIVDSWGQVPEAARARAERVSYEAPAERVESVVPSGVASSSGSGALTNIDWASFGAGFGTALVFALLVFGMRRLGGPFARVALFVVAAAALGGVYFGLLRRTTGQGDAFLASPSAIIQDARNAVDQMNERNKKQDQEIQKILRESR